jgi:hypothetical protein
LPSPPSEPLSPPSEPLSPPSEPLSPPSEDEPVLLELELLLDMGLLLLPVLLPSEEVPVLLPSVPVVPAVPAKAEVALPPAAEVAFPAADVMLPAAAEVAFPAADVMLPAAAEMLPCALICETIPEVIAAIRNTAARAPAKITLLFIQFYCNNILYKTYALDYFCYLPYYFLVLIVLQTINT